jgi:predicted kinase
MIIQIIGLPGSGKTELAKALKERINAIHLNADEVNIVYGRDVGYKIEQVDLGAEIHSISATQKRKEMGI